MTPDDLRALADALADEDFELRDSPMRVRRKWADYLRACADAQPVAHCAMLDSHRRQVEQAIQSAEHPSGMSTHDGKARIDASILRRMLAIIDSLSAAPQAEPIDPHMIVAEDRFPGVPAEPKREPNPDEVICPACTHQFRAIPENVQKQLWALDDVQIGTLSTQGLFASMHPQDVADAVRLVERAHGIGGSDAE